MAIEKMVEAEEKGEATKVLLTPGVIMIRDHEEDRVCRYLKVVAAFLTCTMTVGDNKIPFSRRNALGGVSSDVQHFMASSAPD